MGLSLSRHLPATETSTDMPPQNQSSKKTGSFQEKITRPLFKNEWHKAFHHRGCPEGCLRKIAASNRRQQEPHSASPNGVRSLNKAAAPVPRPLPPISNQALIPAPPAHLQPVQNSSSTQSFVPSPSGNDNAREETQRSLRSLRVNKAAKAAEIAGTGEVAASTPSKDQCCLANEPPTQNNQALNRKVRFHAPVADRVEEPPKVKSSTQSFVPSPSGNGDDRKKTRNSSTQTPLTPGSKHVSKTKMRVQRNIVQAHAGMGGTGQAKASTLAYLEQSPPAGHRQLHVADPTHHNFGIPL